MNLQLPLCLHIYIYIYIVRINRLLYRNWFEVTVCDGSGDEATFVIFDKAALKLVGRQASFIINEMEKVCIINKCNIRYP